MNLFFLKNNEPKGKIENEKFPNSLFWAENSGQRKDVQEMRMVNLKSGGLKSEGKEGSRKALNLADRFLRVAIQKPVSES